MNAKEKITQMKNVSAASSQKYTKIYGRLRRVVLCKRRTKSLK